MNRTLMIVFSAVALLAAATLPAAAAPSAAPCVPGGVYNPVCDVDQNGVIDVLDIQLTAGHWNQNGVFPLDTYWALTGNAGTAPGTNYVGTSDNQALQLRVNGSRALLIQPNGNGSHNLIGGYSGNTVTNNVYGATIAGGGQVNAANIVTDNFGTIGGGRFNQAGNDDSFLDSQNFATVGGGAGNVASASAATVGGGLVNHASGLSSTVGGGSQNDATGFAATVPGGILNLASGAGSFAAGSSAKAIHDNAFVWADGQISDFSSSMINSFNVRAQNGTLIYGNNTNYAELVDNDGQGDGLRALTSASQGTSWAAVYASGLGTSPGLHARTNGTYAGYFADAISVTGGCTGCTLMYVAQNAGNAALEMGDLVAAAGVAEALAGTADPVLRVQQSGPAAQGVVGVVFSRVTVTPSEKEGELLDSVQAADGAVQPGDYLLIVVQGLAQVKVARGEALTPGQRLKAADAAGQARPLRTTVVNGVTLDEGGAVIGVLLDAPDAATGLAPVMVTLR